MPHYTLDVQQFIGRKFNKLTIINITSQKSSRQNRTYFLYTAECTCECGNKTQIRLDSLRHNTRGAFFSCGCHKNKIFNPDNNRFIQDSIGKTVNLLTIKEFICLNKHKRPLVNCNCECGKSKILLLDYVLCGNVKSCGCLSDKHRRSKKLPVGMVPLRNLYMQYRNNAKQRGVLFNLTQEEFAKLINSNCYYCNVPPSNKFFNRKFKTDFIMYNGIDRKDNNVDYFLDNCLPCCSFCNFSKRNNTQEYFYDKIKSIYNNLFKNESK